MKRKSIALMVSVSLLAAGAALAGDDRHERPHHPAEAEHDRALRAVEQGRILPLKSILERAEKAYPGQLIEAELEEGRDGGLVYEIKMLGQDGRLLKLIYDAASGELLKARQREPR